MRIRRPMCLISIVFMIIVFAVMEISGGVDETATVSGCVDNVYNAVSESSQEAPTVDAYDGTDRTVAVLDGRYVTVTGTVIDKIYKNKKYSLHIDDAVINGEKCRDYKDKVIIYLKNQSADDYKIGQRVEVCGRLADFATAENEGQFNMRRYYRVRGYACSVTGAEVTKASKGYDRYREFLYERKAIVWAVFYENMSEENAGVMCAIVLGDKSGLDSDVKELYQAAGISHVLSLSGLHIATVGMALFAALIKIGAGIRGASLISTAVMISYGIMTGMSTSTVRALIMFILGLVAKNIHRTYDLLSAVYLSAMLILIDSPLYIYDSGFLLSVSAVIGIGMLYPVTEGVCKSKRLDKLRQGMCVSISVVLTTLPVVAGSFYKVSRLGILLNIIVVPLMSVVLGFGIFAGVAGCIKPVFTDCINIFVSMVSNKTVSGFGGGILMRGSLDGAGLVLTLYKYLCETVSRIPFNTWVIGKPQTWQIIVYIIFLSGACVIYEISRSGEQEITHNNKETENSSNIVRKPVHSHICVVGMLCMAIVVISLRFDEQMNIAVLSVGQGACNVIYGSDVPTIMIDGGSTDVKEAGKYRIEPFLLSKGIDEIDYLFITHPDEDHISGVKELLNDKNSGIRVRHIFMPVDATDIEQRIHVMRAGDVIENGDLLIECLNPNESYVNYADGNDASLVLKVSYNDFTAIFTGDISAEIEHEIMNVREFDIKDIDFMTASHHGSKYSNSADFICYVNPKIITISAGLNNSYGHPHAETLERLNNAGIPYYRTDECGQITVIVTPHPHLKTYIYNTRGGP